MSKKEKSTELVKFRVTPSEHQLLKRAVASQQSEHSDRFRNHSELYRTLLLRWANKVIADSAAESLQRRRARTRARIHGGKADSGTGS